MAKKAKAKVKSKAKAKSNRELIGKARMRTVTHIKYNAEGQPRRRGW